MDWQVNDSSETALDRRVADGIQTGTLNYTYRGVPMWKCPFDLAIYLQVIWELKPKTILEFGSNAGGSALWLADTLSAFGLTDTKLRSYDIRLVEKIKDPRIEFLKIDVSRPQDFIDVSDLEALPRPLLVIDDASHKSSHVLSLLRFLHPHLRSGDYLIIEDGIIDLLGMSEKYEGGPLAAIKTFLSEHSDKYQIDRARCDAYGKNVTWNVDGYIKRVA